MVWFPSGPLGGSENQFENIKHLVPDHINLMLNNFDFKRNMVNIHWQHQYFDQPSVQNLKDKRIIDMLDHIVFVSYHQKDLFERYLGVPKEKSVVIKNAIWPFDKITKPKGKINLIYTSTPFRGLNVLVVALTYLLKRRPDLADIVHLNVFSSMNLYGKAYSHLDSQYEALYKFCDDHPNITYRGVVSQKDLRKYLEKSHLFTYPCCWEETSCISAIEAMAAGCLPVVSSIGALPETCSHYGIYYSPVATDMYNNENMNLHCEQYSEILEKTISEYRNGSYNDLIYDMYYTVNKYYSWGNRFGEWKEFFKYFPK